ncbi:MAG: cation:proton antiporter [Oscillospiraceae bacterium]|nr:cation:proton antiporter [Oscillospiraceae bacterium]
MSVLLGISIAALAGLFMTRLFKPFRLPDVTAYIVAGIFVGPYFLGRLGVPGLGFAEGDTQALSLICDVALGFIAFSIGNELRLDQLRRTGRNATIIGVVQGLVAALLVDLVLLGVHLLRPDILSVPQAITLGAIATATAPAATLMVVRQYKAKGALTSLLLPIVALDDAVGLVVFAVSFGAAKSMLSGGAELLVILLDPLIEIAASLLLGGLMGLILTFLERYFHSNTNRLSLTILFVFLTVALSKLTVRLGAFTLSFSPLLVCMMLGTVFCNVCPLSADLMGRSDKWTAPLFTLFFVISGAELNVTADPNVLIIGVVYILARSLGKILGAYSSSKATGCEPKISKYLGVTLLPQAGVALGMCRTAMQLGEQGMLVHNVILFSILVYELIGPPMTKWALTKAGDISPKSVEVLNRRAEKLRQAQEEKANRA